MSEMSILYGLVGGLSGVIIGYVMSLRAKSKLTLEQRQSYADIVKNQKRSIIQLRGKLGSLNQINLKGVELEGAGDISQLIDSFVGQLPAGIRQLARPMIEAGKERWATDPKFKEKIMGEVAKHLKTTSKEGGNVADDGGI